MTETTAPEPRAVPPSSGPNALEAHGVERTYRLASETIPVLQGLDLVLRPGETVSVVGTRGMGSSTGVG